MIELGNSPATHKILAEALKLDFMLFVKMMFKYEYRKKFIVTPHHRTITAALMRVAGGECNRLIINVPPRTGKTELLKKWIAWSLAVNPKSKFIYTSYASPLAVESSKSVRDLLSSETYRKLFVPTLIKKDSSAKATWATYDEGGLYAVGVGGSITGFGAGSMDPGFGGAIIIDDPHKAAEASSDTRRQSVLDWFKNSLESRVNKPDTPIVVIMQRLHEEDLSGWLLNGGNGEEWEHLCVPALNEDNNTSFWPEMFPVKRLQRMKKHASYEFSGQYQQDPSPAEGGMFKRAWWQYYNIGNIRRFDRIIQTLDTANKTGQEHDYSVIATWGKVGHAAYLIDIVRGKWEAPELFEQTRLAFVKHMPAQIFVEDKQSGTGLIQFMRREGLPVIPKQVDADKVSRAYSVIGYVNAGFIHLPENAPFLQEFIDEHAKFPNAKNDDIVDTTTSAINELLLVGGVKLMDKPGGF